MYALTLQHSIYHISRSGSTSIVRVEPLTSVVSGLSDHGSVSRFTPFTSPGLTVQYTGFDPPGSVRGTISNTGAPSRFSQAEVEAKADECST